MIRLMFALVAATFVLAGCDAPQNTRAQTFVVPNQANPVSVAPPNAPSGPVVDQFAMGVLNGLQARSFAGQREYCGYIFVDRAGFLQATPPRAGSFAGCSMPEPRAGQGIIASYHTHGSYAPRYDNEVPSVIDLQSDFDYGIDGYVATPGGRVWLVDFQTRTTRQLCGLRCITSDPRFVPENEGGIRTSYSLSTLQQRAAGF